MNDFYKDGLRFSCTRCGHCCRHEPGVVFFSAGELAALSSFLNVSEEEFLSRYCRIEEFFGTRRYTFDEKDNYDCVFWKDGGCSVYDHRPLQCRSYPFWSSLVECEEEWNGEARACPGIGRGELHSVGEIREWLIRRERYAPHEPK